MKDKKVRVFMMLATALMSSCTDEQSVLPDVRMTVSEVVTFTATACEAELTRSTIPEECMNKITDLNVFLYRDGMLNEESSVYAGSSDFQLEIPDISAEYDIYLIANMGDLRDEVMSGCRSRDEMDSWVHDMVDYSRFHECGVPMAGTLRSWRKGDCTTILLSRLVSRIDIRFVNSSGYDLSVRSMRLCHSVRKVAPFGGGYKATSSDDILEAEELNDCLTQEDITAAMNDGVAVSLYCCENMQGSLMPWNTDPKLKNIHNIPPDRAGLVTYFEVDAWVSSDDVRWESVKYRFCLGRDVTGNFDVPRNCILGYTLDFASTPSDTGWTVEPDDPLYPGDIRIFEHISPVYPGWDVFTFPDASPAGPVTVVSPWGEYSVDGVHASLSGDVISDLKNPCIVAGNQLFVRTFSAYELECTSPGMHSSRLHVAGDKEKLSYVLAARNARGETVRVDYLLGGQEYGMYLCPWSETRRRVEDWSVTYFPEPIIELFGRQRVMEFSSKETTVEMYENEGAGDEDSGYRFYPLSSSYGLVSNCGQPYFEISAPEENSCLAYKIRVFGDSGNQEFRDIKVFDDSSLPISYTLPEQIIDNTCGNLYADVNNGIYVIRIEDTDTPYWSAVRNLRAQVHTHINKGDMGFSFDAASKDAVIRLNEYSCGEASARMYFWDYDTAPTGYYVLPLKVYLDITYVPKFGILRHGGMYGNSPFSAASLVHDGAHTVLSSRIWGYQYLPARRDSYYRNGLNGTSSYRDDLLEIVGNSTPSIVSKAYDPGFPDGFGRVALFNSGSILENDESPSTYCDMPNDGSVFFCDPVSSISSAWSLEYNAKVLDPMYRYMFTSVTSKRNLDNIASFQLDNCYRGKPMFRGDEGDSTDMMHVELYDGILVNYHLRYDTCLEMLAGEWDRY